MGLFNIIDIAFNLVFGSLIDRSMLAALVLLALLINVLILYIYKKTTDQDLMKRLKDEMKALQEEIKQLKGHPEQAIEVQKKAMETNMRYMKHSLRPQLYTILPIIIILGWMSAQFSYLPLSPGDEFTATVKANENFPAITLLLPASGDVAAVTNTTQKMVDKTATFGMKARSEGAVTLRFRLDDTTLQKNIVVSDKRQIVSPEKRAKGFIDYLYSSNGEYLTPDEAKLVTSISISNKPWHPLGSLSIFGWEPQWLGTYIILSIILNLVLRKVMKVH